jgi:gliding motility-associated-like protein
MRFAKKIIMIILVSACTISVQAQDPGWTFDPGNYQYTMTIVAFLNVNGKTLTAAQDKVAALVNGEVRGTASPIYVSSADRYLAYLTVFANKENETVEFKIYESAGNKVVDITATLGFKIDAQFGTVFQAFSLASPALRSDAVIENFFFTGADSVSTTITDSEVNLVLEYDQDLHNLSPEFVISPGARMYLDRDLQESGKTTSDFTEPVFYSVLSEDESVLRTYQVNVSNQTTEEGGFVCSNVITANNDGENDYWIVKDVFKYDDHQFRIFDANGRILHESTGYHNDWDGSYKGSKLERGKYFFAIKDPATGTVMSGSILVLH